LKLHRQILNQQQSDDSGGHAHMASDKLLNEKVFTFLGLIMLFQVFYRSYKRG